jgi:regulator of cell morphogenesis and NO signaling
VTALDVNTSVGQWVAQHPATSRIFEASGIDYCCGGNKPLAQACADRKIDPRELLSRLEQATTSAYAAGLSNWLEAPLAALCDHIEQTHHAWLKTELPRLTAIVAKVVRVHGADHPELASVEQSLAELRDELVPHMFKEEMILFPAIRRLEQAAEAPNFPFGTLANPIQMMEFEHDNAGAALARIRELTQDYRVPHGACNTYLAMLDGLHTLEEDMHVHVHKENSILFPRAVSLERERAAR